ncbi:MAG: hypothetical protein QMC95_11675 [Desulfitobacteriaceae bacterium]|nr:hypothetical protein [Desulfitobacteriaceae bacterium]MDI6878921.1 hypothetical protein [Desulfitobacteriaceae bacterium]MDI6914867.1 hypothetical protein [Desulfitobacteriaceae bacterium]
MKYFVGLKSELDLLNENEAKQRYLEMLAAGYDPEDVFVGAPVTVSSDVNFGTLAADDATAEPSHFASGRLDEVPLNPS